MAQVDAVIIEKVQLFLRKLRQTGISVSKAYIFGSYVTGRADEWSDIDIAVFSPQIGDDRFEERVRLTELAITIDDRLEPLPFSLDKFGDDDPFIHMIVTEGVQVS